MKLAAGARDDTVMKQSTRRSFKDAADLVRMVVLSHDFVVVFHGRFEKTVYIAFCVLILCGHAHRPTNIPQSAIITMGITNNEAIILSTARINGPSVLRRVSAICCHRLDMWLRI